MCDKCVLVCDTLIKYSVCLSVYLTTSFAPKRGLGEFNHSVNIGHCVRFQICKVLILISVILLWRSWFGTHCGIYEFQTEKKSLKLSDWDNMFTWLYCCENISRSQKYTRSNHWPMFSDHILWTSSRNLHRHRCSSKKTLKQIFMGSRFNINLFK